jgi:hypothetical protein
LVDHHRPTRERGGDKRERGRGEWGRGRENIRKDKGRGIANEKTIKAGEERIERDGDRRVDKRGGGIQGKVLSQNLVYSSSIQ